MKIFLMKPIDGVHGRFNANTIQDLPEDYAKQLIEKKIGRAPTKTDHAKAKKALTHSPLAKLELKARERAEAAAAEKEAADKEAAEIQAKIDALQSLLTAAEAEVQEKAGAVGKAISDRDNPPEGATDDQLAELESTVTDAQEALAEAEKTVADVTGSLAEFVTD